MKKYIMLFSLTLIFSCNQDFLELENPNALSLNNFPTSAADIESLMVGAYGNQHAMGLYGHTIMGKGFFCWDHTLDMAWQGTQTWIQLTQNDTQPSDAFMQNLWRDLYKGIQRSNTILEVVAKFREDGPSSVTPDQLDEFEGQSRYLRAWYYFHALGIFGEDFIIDGQGGDKRGVPLITEVASNLEETAVPRSSVREGWNLVIDDLTKAQTLIGNKTWSGADAFKIDQWGLKGLLAKTYAFTGDWPNAKPLLADVINNSGKTLVPFEFYKNMFNGDDAFEFNNESLIEIPMTNDVGGNRNQDLATGSWHGMIIAPSHVNPAGNPVGRGWSNSFPHQKNLARFGYNLPHYFPPGTSSVNISNVRPTYVAEALQYREDKVADPRLYVNMLQPYVDKAMAAGNEVTISHYHDGVEAQMQAWSFKKYVHLLDNQSAVRNGGANFYLLRLADIYLLYAEALIKTGEPAQGLEYINKVKRRAYEYPIDAPSPVDYTSLNDQTKASDPVLANNPLKYERFVELFGEGHKWYDDRRWKHGAQEAAYYQVVRGGTINWQDTDYAQPIPTIEIENNSAISVSDQNAGY